MKGRKSEQIAECPLKRTIFCTAFIVIVCRESVCRSPRFACSNSDVLHVHTIGGAMEVLFVLNSILIHRPRCFLRTLIRLIIRDVSICVCVFDCNMRRCKGKMMAANDDYMRRAT